MRRIIRLDDDDSRVNLRDIAVDATDDAITFEAEGVIRGVDPDVLAAIAGSHCLPTAVTFECNEERGGAENAKHPSSPPG